MEMNIITVCIAIFAIEIAAVVLAILYGIFRSSWSPTVLSVPLLALSFILFLMFKPWVFVDNYELGYKFSKTTGQITVLEHSGYAPVIPVFESIHTVDLRPRQVCITVGNQQSTASANRRVLNCKLVQFDPKGLLVFLEWHGRDTYSGEPFDDLLKIYAYDGLGKSYPFLNVLRELKGGEEYSIDGTAVDTTPVVE